jgi:hypothetical protein
MPHTDTDRHDDLDAKLARLRQEISAGKVSLEQAAEIVGVRPQDLMAKLVMHELLTKPGAAALVTLPAMGDGADGVVTVKRSSAEVVITLSPYIAEIVITALLTDPRATAAICAPLPCVTTNPETRNRTHAHPHHLPHPRRPHAVAGFPRFRRCRPGRPRHPGPLAGE